MLNLSPKIHINWEDYSSPNFVPHKFPRNTEFESCGTAAFCTITGFDPEQVDKRYNVKYNEGWHTIDFAKRLRNHGYTVITVSKNNVTNVRDRWHTRAWDNRPLKKNHLIVINGMIMRDENSFFIMHNNKLWHNFRQIRLDPLFFLNKPTQDVLIISNDKWK